MFPFFTYPSSNRIELNRIENDHTHTTQKKPRTHTHTHSILRKSSFDEGVHMAEALALARLRVLTILKVGAGSVYSWRDGRMDGWMGGMGGWMDGWDGWMGWMGGMEGWVDACLGGWMDGWMAAGADDPQGWWSVRAAGSVCVLTEGWVEGGREGGRDGCTYSLAVYKIDDSYHTQVWCVLTHKHKPSTCLRL